MSQSVSDLLAGGHTEGAFNKNSPIGTRVGGTVVSSSPQQMRSFDTQEPEFWDDGRPKMQIKVVVDTGQVDPSIPDDDGHRAFYVKAWGEQLKALRDALKRAGATTIENGAFFGGALVGTRPNAKNSRLNDEKLYQFEYRSPAAQGVSNLLGGQMVDTSTGEVTGAPSAAPAAPAAPAAAYAGTSGDPWNPGQPAPAYAAPAAPAPVPPAAPAAPAPAPPAPPAAPAAPAAPNLAEQAVALVRAGMTDDVIIGALGISADVLAAIKASNGL